MPTYVSSRGTSETTSVRDGGAEKDRRTVESVQVVHAIFIVHNEKRFDPETSVVL